MLAVGLGQQRSEAIGLGSNLCRQIFLPSLFFTISLSKIVTTPLPLLLTHNLFSISEILWRTGRFPYQVFRFDPVRQNFLR